MRGRVQGVGFRYATRERARSLELAGWVRNERDGSVLIRAAGEGAAMESFAAWLNDGPPLARVLEVVVREVSDPSLSRPFLVQR